MIKKERYPMIKKERYHIYEVENGDAGYLYMYR